MVEGPSQTFQREPTMPNAFAHIELNTDDVARAKRFYKSLFKWKFAAMPDYTMIDVGKGTGGGVQKKAIAGSPTLWLPYVEVDDVATTIAKARKLGANIQLDYMDIGEMGAIGVFLDPTGAPLGVWSKAKSKARKAVKPRPPKAAKTSARKGTKKKGKR
jgi:predicted enzyme related to lactoylglutathione lyase